MKLMLSVLLTTLPLLGQQPSPKVFALALDKVLPQIVCGGGWETIMVLLNMGTGTTPFTISFYDEAGRAMQVNFKSYPDFKPEISAVISGQLTPNSSFNFSLFDTGPLQVGWAVIAYDETRGRISGNAVLRQRGGGGGALGIAEAVVPFSNLQDFKFFMPYDNIQGFITAMAIVNPGNVSTRVSFTFFDLNGKVIGRDTFTMAPGTHQAFGLTDAYPFTRNGLGAMYVEGSSGFLSAMGLRFNPTGTFTSVPVLNWSGLFQ